MEFQDTESTMPFLSDDFDVERDHKTQIRQLELQGYIEAPDWMPVPQPGYEWACVNCWTAMMRPKPKLRHWVWYYLLGDISMWLRRRTV